MAPVQQVQDVGEGRPDQIERPRGRERSGHQSAQHRPRVSNRRVNQGEASAPGLVPSHRLNSRSRQGESRKVDKDPFPFPYPTVDDLRLIARCGAARKVRLEQSLGYRSRYL